MLANPRVFISYSHDSREHCAAVLALAQQLRRDGIAAELDQFHQEELQHWPRWCEEQMRPDNADFVLCICTAEYARRVEGRVAADVGKGVFWEGTLIYDELYDSKGNPRCVPVLLDGDSDADIPRVLKNWTWFRLEKLDKDEAESGYAKLYRLLTRQAGIRPEAIGAPASLPALPAAEEKTDFMALIADIQRGVIRIEAGVGRIEQQGQAIAAGQTQHEQKSGRRHALVIAGLASLLVLTPVGFWVSSHWTAQQVEQAIDPAMIGERLRTEIQARYERDADAAHKAGKNWEAIRELEKNRDAALIRVDDIVATIRDGLAGNPGPIFAEASRILEREGTDAALAYLESHKTDILARADRAAAQVEADQARLRQDLQPLLLQADLHETRQEWQAALELLKTVAAKAPHWWGARLRLGNALEKQARYAEAETQLRAALALAAEEKDQAVASNGLALLLLHTNRLAEAEPLLRRALAIDEKSYGPEHPDVATDLNNLAGLLQATNRLAEAEPLMRRALAIDEESYGPEHPKVAIRLNNLAQLLKDTNRLAEAEPLMRRALAIDEKSYGPEHPEVATALNNLAQLLKATNRLAEAEPPMRRVVAIFEKSYGPEHPNVANALNNLAGLLYATNRLAEAEPLLRRALAIAEKSYGPEHPNVANALNNLAGLLYATNRLTEAEPLLRRALTIDEKSNGPEHPDVAVALNNLARLLQDTSRLAEAEPLMKRVVAIFEKSYGPEHPNVATALNNLAQLLKATHRLAEAEPLYRKALAIDEKSYGPEHPDVAIALNNLAALMYATNRLEEAEPLMRRHLVIFLKFTRATGHEHPHLRAAFANYQQLLQALHLPPAQIQTRLAAAAEAAGYGAAEWAALQARLQTARVVALVPGSQAERLGIQPGDIILRYAGQKITGVAQLVELTGKTRTSAIPLTIQRAGQDIHLTAQPGTLGVQLE
jgi:tetratricopeptide (TPR) repeat protein